MPAYPQRPDHPDFWMISQAVIETDQQSEHGQEIPDILGRIADTDSVLYAAEQRVQRAASRLTSQQRVVMTMLWIDGFIAGARFQHLKAIDAQKLPNGWPGDDAPRD